jgi:hypothetical protein
MPPITCAIRLNFKKTMAEIVKKRRRVVFQEDISTNGDLQIEGYAAYFIQNNGTTDVWLDRRFKLAPGETFHAMLLPEAEEYFQKIHISFGTINVEDEENPTEGIKELVNVAFTQ